MLHLDLFSGIGGFAYAADQVWGDVEHVFCDNSEFCQQVLKKHWPEAVIYGDIRDITDTSGFGCGRWAAPKQREAPRKQKDRENLWNEPSGQVDLITGGFPCQPFSAAGLRRGTADERHLWPEMLRVIRLTKPAWVIAENVRGLIVWNDGLVLEQVCTDLEAAGYEVQPLIIPAVAVNAPHRRDRVWFIAHTKYPRQHGAKNSQSNIEGTDTDTAGPDQFEQPTGPSGLWAEPSQSWQADWTKVAAELCSVDDGLPVRVGRFELSKPQHRKEQIKAYGNAIVPQVAVEIMRAIKSSKTACDILQL